MPHIPIPPPPPKPKPKTLKSLTISNYERLEHNETPLGWVCRVSLEQPDSYRFLFDKIMWSKTGKDFKCSVEMKLDRDGIMLYDPNTFNSDVYHTVYVMNDENRWVRLGKITKTDIGYKNIFLVRMEKICEEYKEIVLKNIYNSLPWYKKLIYKTLKIK
jgi:hypothetical protein